MNKIFKISFITIFVVAIGYIIPVYLISVKPPSLLEKRVRAKLSSFENFFILKVVEDGAKWPKTAKLYTWFGLKYGRIKTVEVECSDLALCYGESLSRFWTKEDVLINY